MKLISAVVILASVLANAFTWVSVWAEEEPVCDYEILAYEVRDFAPEQEWGNKRWTFCGETPPTAEVLKSIPHEPLSKISSFDAGVEANRRGVAQLEKEKTYASLKQALAFFQMAANQGHPEAYTNLALTHFALTNLKEASTAAQIGALLKQPEAMGLLAYFKIEAVHTERDLAKAFQLVTEAESLGADLKSVSSLDMSYQFFPQHWTAVQKGLTDAGLFEGKLDGIFGEDSKEALYAFQKQEGLPVTSKIHLALLDKLNLLENFNQHVEAQKYIYGRF